MAKKFFFKKALGGTLIPTTEASREWLESLPHGEVVSGEFKRPRNGRHHAKFFAMLDLVFKNQSHYKSVEEILLVFKHHVGHGKWIVTKQNGDISEVFMPGSISFAKMDQAAFEDFYNKAVDFVCTTIIPGLEEGDLRRELEGFAA